MQIPRLHPDTIEQVKQRADIVEVISEKVVLRKRGKDFQGLCPFHDEKSPSFSVSPHKQMYYCFGCQAGGNVITFLMELEKQSFADVVLNLARRYSIPVQTLEPEQRQELQRQLTLREQLFEILAVTAAFYQHALYQPSGKAALEYLRSERQLNDETIQKFQLGYAPVGWETLYRYLVEQKGFSVPLVEQAGLIRRRKESQISYYDYFRDRLIIPIHDLQGRVIGFGGRTLADEQPKYLNSPETQLFNKGKTLFALNQAKDAISKQDLAVVVEGYFDAIALHAAGITNAVASLGTALSLDQVKLLLRYNESKQLVLNFDADKAGNTAAKRAIGEIANLAYRGEIQLRILNLPNGKDADEYLRTYSAEQYQNLLNEAPLWLAWQIEQLLEGKDLRQANQYQQVAEEMVKILGNIIDDNQLTHYINQCAESLSRGDSRQIPLISQNLLNKVVQHWKALSRENQSLQMPLLIENLVKRNYPQAKPQLRIVKQQTAEAEKVVTTQRDDLLKIAEALLLRLYVHCPEYRQDIIDGLETHELEFSFSHHRFLWQQIREIDISLSSENLISKLHDKAVEFPKEMAQVSRLFILDEMAEANLYRAGELIKAAIARMEQIMCEKQSRQFLALLEKTDSSTEPEMQQKYYQEFIHYKQRSMELEQQCQVSISDLLQL
ncbi:DNA primase [Phormidium sp. LEGE 05292]|uniref:DNA primase n=1 Tax=[Phormidium] sp. LEGE 05292 TaxID=767427 RepID=UPI00188268DC|nr:DNA primase [Phormidium sp. LEGE 05292]MBE9226594.1 DNA primase [Phormidium sp. LEGE 05292]